jgi:hypothetical protein
LITGGAATLMTCDSAENKDTPMPIKINDAIKTEDEELL